MESHTPKGGMEDLSRDLEEAISKCNYIRAERLARHLNRPEAEIKDLQEKAFRQYVLEYRNPQGAATLVKEFNFSSEDVSRVLRAILQETHEEGPNAKSKTTARFDVEAMGYLGLEEWVKKYFNV